MITCYRLSSARFPADSGAGAALYGGRWNPVGVEAIYTAATRSLAVLEVLVHFAVLPLDFAVTQVTIPDELKVLVIDEPMLPSGWAGPAAMPATQQIGAGWLAEGRYAAMSVPSSVVQEERNFVLNPKHPEFARIRFSTSVPFRFDPRLK